jgi:hypothetical protein
MTFYGYAEVLGPCLRKQRDGELLLWRKAVLKKVNFGEFNRSQVSIAVMKADDGVIVGRVVANPVATATGPGLFTTAPYDPPVAEAISIAKRYAAENNIVVSVYDPANLLGASA